MFRNREIRQFAIVFFLIAVPTVTAGFAIDRAAGILAAFSSSAFGILFFVFTRARYHRIARISEQIDLVLHNEDDLYIGESEEGELSILHSEVTKMTQRIREQNEALKKEKKYLADSLADIAHQLRTPLTSANLILSLLETNPDRDEQKELLRETEELFQKMDWLLASLLKISRLDAGIVDFQKEDIKVSRLVQEALRPLLISMELHEISVETRIPGEAMIAGDAGWISEAIQNILKNCMESAGERGKIEIICEETPLFTEIRIHDNGAGFEAEDIPHLFDRFYRGKGSKATGYGIGLALCRTIIVRQGGTVTAENHPQGGAFFAVRFPK